MWTNIVESGRPRITIWRMRIACWIPKATNTQTRNMQYLLLFHGNWLHKSASVLRLYEHCLACSCLVKTEVLTAVTTWYPPPTGVSEKQAFCNTRIYGSYSLMKGAACRCTQLPGYTVLHADRWLSSFSIYLYSACPKSHNKEFR